MHITQCCTAARFSLSATAPRQFSVIRVIRGHRETKYCGVEPESGVIRLVSMSLSQICFQIAKIRKLNDTRQENMVKPAKYGRETTARRFVTLENHHCQQTKCLQASQACTMDEMQDMKTAAKTCQNIKILQILGFGHPNLVVTDGLLT